MGHESSSRPPEADPVHRSAFRDILAHRFRLHPHYEVVAAARLAAEEIESMRAPVADPEWFGILRPVEGSGLTVKSISRAAARVLEGLSQPGRLSGAMVSELGSDANRQVVGLVLDDILEIEHEAGFVSGPAALGALYSSRQAHGVGGRLSRLSLDAIGFGFRMPLEDPLLLAAQVYFYHRAPVTPLLRRRLGDTSRIADFLSLDADGASGRVLRRLWRPSRRGDAPTAWIAWKSLHHESRGRVTTRDRARSYKMYVSPATADLPQALPIVLRVLGEAGARTLKVGADVQGLVRPDKLVAHFDRFETLEQAAQALTGELGGMSVHGVPFSAEIGLDGLLSWGLDPRDRPVTDDEEGTSWRWWLTQRIARSLLSARASDLPLEEAVDFAIDRLGIDGIDTASWAPLGEYEMRHAAETRQR